VSNTTLPTGWTRVSVDDLRQPGDYTLVGGPFGSDLTQHDYLNKPGVPVIRGSNLGGSESRFIDDGFVFVSEHKAASLARNCAFPGDVVFTQRGTLGQVAVVPEDAKYPRYIISQSQMKLTPNRKRVETRYLYHYFRTPQTLALLLAQTQVTGVPHINLGILKRFPVLLPPLSDQRRIADVLDRAEALRAKRRAALAQLDTLTQAIFLEMFGDSAASHSSWDVLPFANLVQEFRYGTSNKSQTEGKPALRIPNVVGGIIDPTELKTVPADEAEFERLRLRDGDVLFVRTNGNPDFVGRCAVFESQVVRNTGFGARDFIYASYLIRARLSSNTVTPLFLREYMLGSEGRRQLRARCSTSAGQFNINTENLGSIPVPVPPLALQHEFARRVVAVEQLRTTQRESLGKMDEFFASLQHRAFRGEL
jgi:type I restriction enzyme S subunit